MYKSHDLIAQKRKFKNGCIMLANKFREKEFFSLRNHTKYSVGTSRRKEILNKKLSILWILRYKLPTYVFRKLAEQKVIDIYKNIYVKNFEYSFLV